jgi:hypothetical protein
MTPREVQEMIDRQIAALGEGGKARLRASQAVDKLFMAAQAELGSIKTLKQREQERAAEKLYVAYRSLDEFLEPFRESESVTAEIFDHLQRIIMATHDLGRHDAPDGRAARAARSDLSGEKRWILFKSIMEYLLMHPERKPQISENFANIIRPGILELLRLPKESKWPTLDEIKEGVGWVKRQGAPPPRRNNSQKSKGTL